jgi:hypothetical protein
MDARNRTTRLGFGLAILLAGTAPSLADITVNQSSILSGSFVLSGEAPPNQTVSIVGTSFMTMSDDAGAFRFVIQYLPPSCMIDLIAGRDRYDDILVANCGPEGARGPEGPEGAVGAHGRQGAIGLAGVDGKDGVNGVDGVDGIDGVDGEDGVDGIDGVDGEDGVDGDRWR